MLLQIMTSLLRSGPVVQPVGMTSSVPCRKLEFGPSRYCGTSYTMATWLPRDRPRWLNAGREEETRGEGEGGRGVRLRE